MDFRPFAGRHESALLRACVGPLNCSPLSLLKADVLLTKKKAETRAPTEPSSKWTAYRLECGVCGANSPVAITGPTWHERSR